MKKVLIMAVICSMALSCAIPAQALVFSEDGIASWREKLGEEVTVLNGLEVDFENTGVSVGNELTNKAGSASSGAMPRLSSEQARSGSYSAREYKNTTDTANLCCKFYLPDNTPTTSAAQGFVVGQTYTAEAYIWFEPTDGLARNFQAVMLSGVSSFAEIYKGNSVRIEPSVSGGTYGWQRVSTTFTHEAANVEGLVFRINLPTYAAASVYYVDDIKVGTLEMSYDNYDDQPVDWLSYENFEELTALNAETTNPSNNLGSGGESGTNAGRSLRADDNAYSGQNYAALTNKGAAIKNVSGNNTLVQGHSYALKFYNLFGLTERTPYQGSTWTRGWEKFTEADIGRTFLITAYVYADSSGGAWKMYTPNTKMDELPADVEIKAAELNKNDDETKPNVSIGVYGPSNSAANDSNTYTYAASAYKHSNDKIEWDEWTKISVVYEVGEDSIYKDVMDGANLKNTLVNAVRVDSTYTPIGSYYPSSLYIDNLEVYELASFDEDGDGFTATAYVDAEDYEVDGTDVIFAVYNKSDNRLLDVKTVEFTGTGKYTSPELAVDSTEDLYVKVFLWNRENLIPYAKNAKYMVRIVD